MAVFKQVVYVHLHAEQILHPNTKLEFFNSDMSNYGYTCIAQKEIEFEINPREVIPKQVETLKEEITRIQARTEVEIGKLQSRMENLLCLEMDADSDSYQHDAINDAAKDVPF